MYTCQMIINSISNRPGHHVQGHSYNEIHWFGEFVLGNFLQLLLMLRTDQVGRCNIQIISQIFHFLGNWTGVSNRLFTAIDTPGFGDTENNDNEVCKQLK